MRILSILHQEDAPTGLFGDCAREAGHELDEWVIANGEQPPAPPGAYDAVLVFGGAMHVDQEERHGWLRDEDALMRGLVAGGVPTLGVCLGSQLLAKALDGRVGPAREPEIGWHEVELTPEAAGDPLFAAAPRRFTALQWHEYAVELPAGAVPLAESAVCLQAFRAGEAAWGVQFHPEVTREILERWLEEEGRREAFEDDLESRLADWNAFGRSLCARFFEFAARRGACRGSRRGG
jgi:GMP synthase-like glutamine amidotransferase